MMKNLPDEIIEAESSSERKYHLTRQVLRRIAKEKDPNAKQLIYEDEHEKAIKKADKIRNSSPKNSDLENSSTPLPLDENTEEISHEDKKDFKVNEEALPTLIDSVIDNLITGKYRAQQREEQAKSNDYSLNRFFQLVLLAKQLEERRKTNAKKYQERAGSDKQKEYYLNRQQKLSNQKKATQEPSD